MFTLKNTRRIMTNIRSNEDNGTIGVSLTVYEEKTQDSKRKPCLRGIYEEEIAQAIL